MNNKNSKGPDVLNMYRSALSTDYAYHETVVDIAMESLQQEAYLCDLALQGDQHAKDRLVTQHMPLITSLAYQLIRKSNIKASMLDLVAVGETALEDAIWQFNEHYGVRLAQFASIRIREEMKRELCSPTKQDRLPVHIQKQIQQLARIKS